MLDVRKDFPILQVPEAGKRLVYLDTAATAQRPNQVIDAICEYYKNDNANPHRGVYELGARATERTDSARHTVAQFVGADDEEIVFTQNTTESVNLVAYTWGMANINAGDDICVYVAEHHSDMVPWQRVAKRTGARVVYMYPDENGVLTEEEMRRKISRRTKIVCCAMVSNVLGIKIDEKALIERAHSVGAKVLLDCAQSIPHFRHDFHAIGCDFAVFSGHKLYGPMGIGVLYGKKALLDAMEPFLSGGDMIGIVTEDGATWAETPRKFEAGTRNVEGEVGLEAAIKYLDSLGWENIEAHERELVDYCLSGMKKIPHIEIYGNAPERYGVISFNVEDVHPHDVASILDADGVCVRAGHHCAEPLMRRLGIGRCSRASFGIYNTKEDVDVFLNSLGKIREFMGYGS